jgi:hypothetical protein
VLLDDGEEELDGDEELPVALPVRDFSDCVLLDPVPALSRLQAAMPTANAAAVNAAVMTFRFICISC